MKPGIFDERDDLDHPLNQDDLRGRLNLQEYQNSQLDGREEIWRWRREEWEKCCKLGPGHIFAFNLPRRCGKTRMAHHIATKGFQVGTKILVVCTARRAMLSFAALGKEQFSIAAALPSPKEDWDVIIIDEADYIALPEDIRQIDEKATIFLFGSDIKDYHSDHYSDFSHKA